VLATPLSRSAVKLKQPGKSARNSRSKEISCHFLSLPPSLIFSCILFPLHILFEVESTINFFSLIETINLCWKFKTQELPPRGIDNSFSGMFHLQELSTQHCIFISLSSGQWFCGTNSLPASAHHVFNLECT
jgi:hypothetical protein